MSRGIICNETNKIPKGEHYALLVQESYSSDGGYPEDSSTRYEILEYRAFTDKQEFETEVKRLTLDTGYNKKSFVAMKVNPVTISVNVKVG